MPSTNKSIRIIERKQRETLRAEGEVVPPPMTERQIQRGMAQTVASWIAERREVVKATVRSNFVRNLLPLRPDMEKESS